MTTNQLLEMSDTDFIQYLADAILDYRRVVAVAKSRLNKPLANEYNQLIVRMINDAH